MSRKTTLKVNTTNRGGIHVPHPERSGAQWRILTWDDQGSLSFIEVHLPNDSCPKQWLEDRKMILGVDALAERIR